MEEQPYNSPRDKLLSHISLSVIGRDVLLSIYSVALSLCIGLLKFSAAASFFASLA